MKDLNYKNWKDLKNLYSHSLNKTIKIRMILRHQSHQINHLKKNS